MWFRSCKRLVSTIFSMEKRLRPVVARIPAIKLPPQLQQIVDKDEDHFDMISVDPSDVSDELVQRVEGLVNYMSHSHIDAKLMDLFPNLKVISNFGVGVNHIDIAAANERGIAVGNTPGVLTECTADMAFALLMASARNVVEGDRIARSPETKQFSYLHGYYGSMVSGSTIGIVGLGQIGCAVAKRANGFDMKVLYYSRNRKEVKEKQFGAQYCNSLKDLLRQSDFVVLCTPLTNETTNMITAREFSLMKPTATLVNISRGGVVNHTDLTNALQNGVIRAAALDVTEPEPLPRDHPLLKLSNVTFTPHFGSATADTRMKMMEVVMMNLKAGLKGEKLPFGVN
ncbi:hypothetical protein ACROYT_G042588 [Oculina patagonica]